MDRRLFLAASSASLLIPGAALAAATGEPYREGLVVEKLAAGETVFLDFYTDWCSTCRAQGRAINALKKENPAYEQAMSFVAVDWDQHARSQIAQVLEIRRRSTLVLLKGGSDFGRIVAGTSKSEIKALMDKGLEIAAA